MKRFLIFILLVLVPLTSCAETRRVLSFVFSGGGRIFFEEEGLITVPNLVAYWDASETSSVTKDGSDYITGMSDLSGNGKDLVSAATSYPLFVANELNGKSIMRLDGTNDYMKSTANLIGDEAAHTIIAVVNNKRSAEGYGGIVTSTSPGTDDAPAIVLINQTYYFRGAGGGTGEIGVAVPYNEWHVLTHLNAGRNEVHEALLDGVSKGADAPTNATANVSGETWVGTYRCAAQDAGQLDIAAIAIFSRALSEAEREEVEQYFITKFAIS